jgi:hypothetical protein
MSLGIASAGGFSVGSRLRISDRSDPVNQWIEGTVYSVNGNQVTIRKT